MSSLESRVTNSIHHGRRYLITGAGSGMGRATAQRLAEAGAYVALADRDVAACAAVADRLSSQGAQAISIPTDVTDEQQVAAMVDEACAVYGGLDGAFNNAGAAAYGSYRFGTPLAEVGVEAFRGLFEVNTLGVFLCLKHQLRALAGTEVSIVVNASVAGLIGLANGSPYVASKHAAIGLVKAASLETAGSGIRVNAVCPGFVETPMLMDRSTPETRRTRAASTPVGRLADADEVAALVCWLLSTESSYLTGATIPVDGGLSTGPTDVYANKRSPSVAFGTHEASVD